MKNDINNMNDIRLLVDSFYGKIRKGGLLKDIFNNKIQNRWPQHLDKMYRFWQTVLLKSHTYYGSPFMPHAELPVSKIHFEQWLKLFFETVNEHFEGENASRAIRQGEIMAKMFRSKIENLRNNQPSILQLPKQDAYS